MVLTLLHAIQWKFTNTYILTDSECTQAALNYAGLQFRPYFSHWVAEIMDNIEEISKHCNKIHDIFHIPGVVNVADPITMGAAQGKDNHTDFEWLRGPKFRSKSTKTLPLSKDKAGQIPPTEIKVHVAVVQSTDDRLYKLFENILINARSLNQAIGTTAQVMWAKSELNKPPEDALCKEVPLTERDEDLRLLIIHESGHTTEDWEQGKLDYLNPWTSKQPM